MSDTGVKEALQAVWDHFHPTPGMTYGPQHPSHKVGRALSYLKVDVWNSVYVEPIPAGKLLEVGWYNTQGKWCVYLATLRSDGKFYTNTGETIAAPDWWKEITTPPPR